MGRPGQFGDVMMTYLPPFLPHVYAVVEMVADTSSLHHQIDQAFLIFFCSCWKRWKGLGTRPYIVEEALCALFMRGMMLAPELNSDSLMLLYSVKTIAPIVVCIAK